MSHRRTLLLGILAALAAACGGSSLPPSAPTPTDAVRADDLLVVDCLLPGEIRQLGKRVTYATPRRPVKTTAVECALRGGEYTAYDRANRASALRVWLPEAELGNAEAQYYVGAIYEKGLGLAPDYALAAEWYRRSAEQDDARAQVNLGQLYERGLGVPRDPRLAIDWYRRASGLETGSLPYLPSAAPVPAPVPVQVPVPSPEDAALRAEVERLNTEVERLRQEREQVPSPEDAALRAEVEQLRQERAQIEAEERARSADASALGEERQRLEQERTRIEQLREELEARASETGAAREETDKRRAELQQEAQDLATHSELLAAREREAENRERELDARAAAAEQPAPEREQTQREANARPQPEPEAPAQPEVELPAPTIQLIEPPLAPTRGVGVAVAESPSGERPVVGRVEALAGLMALLVNDVETDVDGQGLFQSRVVVGDAGTQVSVVAIDRRGKRSIREFRLSPSQSAPTSVPAPEKPPDIAFGDFHALVIGNDDYVAMPDLSTARNDARAVAELLHEKYGFEVTLLLDANRYQILSALNRLRGLLDENDNLLIYYAGHGELDEANARGHWLPVDAEADSTANWISNVAVTDILNAMVARHILVVADSCYSGALTRSALAHLDPGMSDQARVIWIRKMIEKRSRVALTSGGLEPVLDAGGGGHSVFARVFLDVLEQNQEVIEGARLHAELAARVTWAAYGRAFEQTPQYAPIRFAGHEAGDFFLVPRR